MVLGFGGLQLAVEVAADPETAEAANLAANKTGTARQYDTDGGGGDAWPRLSWLNAGCNSKQFYRWRLRVVA